MLALGAAWAVAFLLSVVAAAGLVVVLVWRLSRRREPPWRVRLELFRLLRVEVERGGLPPQEER